MLYPQAMDTLLCLETAGNVMYPLCNILVPVVLVDDEVINGHKAVSGEYYIYLFVDESHTDNSEVPIVLSGEENDNVDQRHSIREFIVAHATEECCKRMAATFGMLFLAHFIVPLRFFVQNSRVYGSFQGLVLETVRECILHLLHYLASVKDPTGVDSKIFYDLIATGYTWLITNA